MKFETFLNKIKGMSHPQELDKEWGGSCPCFYYEGKLMGKNLIIQGRCWRVSQYGQQDLHIDGDLSRRELRLIGNAIKEKLDAQEWYGSYVIIYNKL